MIRTVFVYSVLLLLLAGCSKPSCVCEIYDDDWNYMGYMEGHAVESGSCSDIDVGSLISLSDDDEYDTIVCINNLGMN